VFELTVYHEPVVGRNTVGSAFPSPSKSPTIGAVDGACAVIRPGETSMAAIATPMPAHVKELKERRTRIPVDAVAFIM
jgi:hypothetical protein